MTPLQSIAQKATNAMHEAGVFDMPRAEIGRVCNEHGDLLVFGLPLMEGLVGIPLDRAIAAIPYGWGWGESYDLCGSTWVAVQRGGSAWKGRS